MQGRSFRVARGGRAGRKIVKDVQCIKFERGEAWEKNRIQKGYKAYRNLTNHRLIRAFGKKEKGYWCKECPLKRKKNNKKEESGHTATGSTARKLNNSQGSRNKREALKD